MQPFFLLFVFFSFSACSHAKNPDAALASAAGSIPKPASAKNISAIKPLIILDPGHGGYDIGARSQACEEKKVALQTTLLVKKYLSEMGYRILLTRQDDTFIPLKKRAAIANDANARLFVSIHYNAAKNQAANGIEVYYYDKSSDWRISASKRLGRCVLSRLLERTGAASRGVKGGNFLVIRETNMPAILIEGGFITHGAERAKLKDSQYIEKVSRAIAEGVDRFFKTK
ncbi:MAG: N-acetylmuramoyl-L-alanine amidase [Simkaniaceae bacterium]